MEHPSRDLAYEDLETESAREIEENEKYAAECARDDFEESERLFAKVGEGLTPLQTSAVIEMEEIRQRQAEGYAAIREKTETLYAAMLRDTMVAAGLQGFGGNACEHRPPGTIFEMDDPREIPPCPQCLETAPKPVEATENVHTVRLCRIVLEIVRELDQGKFSGRRDMGAR